MKAGLAKRTTDNKTVARLLDLKASATYTGLSYWSVRELYLRGEVPHIRFGKKILIDKNDLDTWIERSKEIWC